jgi:hypothetical protein
LNQNIENIAVLIHCAPQVSSLTSNCGDVNFIQIPCVAKSSSTFLDRSSIGWTEFVAPAADWFVGNNNSTFRQKILNIAKAETESVIKPDRMADDFGRKTISSVLGFCLIHAISLADRTLSWQYHQLIPIRRTPGLVTYFLPR